MAKIFVEVTAVHDTNGNTRPLSLKWGDGRVFEIDRVLDVRKAPKFNGNGVGTRYTCRIGSKEFYLFDDGKWYIMK